VIINNTRVVNNISIQNNVVVNRGFDPRIVEKASGRPVRPMAIERIGGVMPGPRVSRAQLRVDPRRVGSGLHAAEPVPASRPLPAIHQHESMFGQRPAPATLDRSAPGNPRGPRRMSDGGELGGWDKGANPHATNPGPRSMYQPPQSSHTGKVEQRAPGSTHQQAALAQNSHQTQSKNAGKAQQPSGKKSSGHKEETKPHGSGKD
jgi:hypothetical protein